MGTKNPILIIKAPILGQGVLGCASPPRGSGRSAPAQGQLCVGIAQLGLRRSAAGGFRHEISIIVAFLVF